MASLRHKLKGMPWGQLLVVAIMRFAEPVSFTSLFPYIYFMVKRFDIAAEEDVARYAGYISGAFALCQSMTGILWGSLSDKYGRKPIVLVGLFGSALSMFLFGFSSNFYMAVGARCVAGLLNGNVGVIRTMLGEIATNRAHQSVAFGIMPLLWQIGCVIGPMLGGYLSEPVESHPDWFEEGSPAYSLFSKYPFALPNLIVTTVLINGWIVAFFFLKETHELYKDDYDLGRRISSRVIAYFKKPKPSEKLEQSECSPLLEGAAEDDVESNYARSTSSDTIVAINNASDITEASTVVKGKRTPDGVDMSWGAILTPEVKNVLFSGMVLALQCVVYEELLPIFLETEIDTSSKFPMRLVGGLSMDAERVGTLLSINGFVGIFMMLVIFPYVDNKFGSLHPYRIALAFYPIIYFVVPYFVLLAKASPAVENIVLIVNLFLRTALNSMANPLLLLVTNRTPATIRHLGAVNGCVQVCGSFARALGPIVWGILMAQGQRLDIGQLPWWALGAVATIGAFQSKLLIDRDDDGQIIR